MIGGGVTFQPGSQDDYQKRINPNAPSGTQEGVQEAIKVLSLRLPKVVGANAPVPTPLLTAEGAQGNRRVDSIVAQVMQKYFPTDTPEQPMAPGAPSPMPQMQQAPRTQQPEKPPASPWNDIPRIIVGNPPEAPMTGGPPHPGAPTWDGGGGMPGGMIGELPPGGLPDLKKQLDWLPGPEPSFDAPLI